MLCLSRKLDQSLVIGDNIRVTIVKIEGSRIVLGVDAPRDVIVHREEVWNAINKPKEDTE